MTACERTILRRDLGPLKTEAEYNVQRRCCLPACVLCPGRGSARSAGHSGQRLGRFRRNAGGALRRGKRSAFRPPWPALCERGDCGEQAGVGGGRARLWSWEGWSRLYAAWLGCTPDT